MTDKATREGAENEAVEVEVPVEETPKEEVKEAPKSARQAVVDAIAAKRRAEFEPREEPSEDVEPEVASEPEEKPEMVTIKVDGREQQVPKDKVLEFGIRGLQKELAADARLAEAANLRRQVEQDQARLNAERAQMQREKEISAMAAQIQQADQKGSHPAKGADEYRDIAKAALRAVFDGEEDEAANQLVRLTAGRENVTPQDLQRMAAEATKQAKIEIQRELRQEKWALEAREAKEWFEQEHKDIATDPEWRSMTDRETADLVAQHPDWFPKQIVKVAVERIERLRKSTSGIADKGAVKRQIDVPRTAAGRMPAPKEPAPQTRSDYIKEIRRSRGLPV
jgi:hypothetical protein